MGLLRNGLSVLNFDETYFHQAKLQLWNHESINLQHIQHVNLYCEHESLSMIQSYLNKREEKGITMIGSGNYHYVTYLLLQEIQFPFTLVLFDNHLDVGLEHSQDETLLSCGSWVAHALKKLSLLKRVVIVGPTAIYPPHFHHPQVIIFPYDERGSLSAKKILSAIHTKHIYISIDKDVLSPKEVITNWDQGKMNVHELLYLVNCLLDCKFVIGVDICGEWKMTGTEMLSSKERMKFQKNENVNIQLLEILLQKSPSQLILH